MASIIASMKIISFIIFTKHPAQRKYPWGAQVINLTWVQTAVRAAVCINKLELQNHFISNYLLLLKILQIDIFLIV